MIRVAFSSPVSQARSTGVARLLTLARAAGASGTKGPLEDDLASPSERFGFDLVLWQSQGV